jgi:hypothetical protein
VPGPPESGVAASPADHTSADEIEKPDGPLPGQQRLFC